MLEETKMTRTVASPSSPPTNEEKRSNLSTPKEDDDGNVIVIVDPDDKLNGLAVPSSNNTNNVSPSGETLTGSHSRRTDAASMNQNSCDSLLEDDASQNHPHNPSFDSATHESSGTQSNFHYSDGSFLPYTPRHSDFTIPTSNKGAEEQQQQQQLLKSSSGDRGRSLPNGDDDDEPRRNIFGNAVQRKYKTDLRTEEDSKWDGSVELMPSEDDLLFPNSILNHQHQHDGDDEGMPLHRSAITPSNLYDIHGGGVQQQQSQMLHHRHRDNFISDMTLPDFREETGFRHRMQRFLHSVTSMFRKDNRNPTIRRKSSDLPSPPPPGTTSVHHPHYHYSYNRDGTPKVRRKRPHETVHAQSLLLGLAFCAVWSANNVMAPNLTEMADFFGLQGAAERDLYLGSYCALATGVFSFPIAAGIGVLADLMSRQRLFCITVAGGGISAIITARARTYPILFLARLVNGGFMAGSTPVAFSFLGDLFAVEERNAASSGLTAMMGLGIILGQVYAGMQGPSVGWQHAFYVSGFLALFLALLCLLLVQEPERGGKEKVLQDMIRAGTRYDRKLTWSGFWHAVRHNESNSILLWQGFFSSLPWGVIFVFLNDYLSQERGFSVPAATYLVFLFGLGCAAGGVLGGYWGQEVQRFNRCYLPIFMAITTLLGIVPFICLLNTHFTRAHGAYGIILALSSGLIASLPSVNVRPCLINVNPPETRGACLTAANLLVSLGRGVGPSCVTLMGSMFQVDRSFSINVTLILFWVISAFQLALLARTLPKDQDSMEAELASYAKAAMERCNVPLPSSNFSVPSHLEEHDDGNDSIEVSIEDRMTYFDGTAAKQTLLYVKEGMEEFRQSLAILPCACADIPESSEEDESPRPSPNTSMIDTTNSSQWFGREDEYPTENTPLIV